MVSAYQKEQADALKSVLRIVRDMDDARVDRLRASCTDYLRFRRRVDRFLDGHFSDVCTRACYTSHRSACCSREGIITFFADVAINVLFSDDAAVENLLCVLAGQGRREKCIYLGDGGCLWQIKPIVCAMFLCDRAKAAVFQDRPDIKDRWAGLAQQRKRFTWPDQPVLFDDLERAFMRLGCVSPLMYLHREPGLLRVKQMAAKAAAATTG